MGGSSSCVKNSTSLYSAIHAEDPLVAFMMDVMPGFFCHRYSTREPSRSEFRVVQSSWTIITKRSFRWKRAQCEYFPQDMASVGTLYSPLYKKLKEIYSESRVADKGMALQCKFLIDMVSLMTTKIPEVHRVKQFVKLYKSEGFTLGEFGYIGEALILTIQQLLDESTVLESNANDSVVAGDDNSINVDNSSNNNNRNSSVDGKNHDNTRKNSEVAVPVQDPGISSTVSSSSNAETHAIIITNSQSSESDSVTHSNNLEKLNNDSSARTLQTVSYNAQNRNETAAAAAAHAIIIGGGISEAAAAADSSMRRSRHAGKKSNGEGISSGKTVPENDAIVDAWVQLYCRFVRWVATTYIIFCNRNDDELNAKLQRQATHDLVLNLYPYLHINCSQGNGALCVDESCCPHQQAAALKYQEHAKSSLHSAGSTGSTSFRSKPSTGNKPNAPATNGKFKPLDTGLDASKSSSINGSSKSATGSGVKKLSNSPTSAAASTLSGRTRAEGTIALADGTLLHIDKASANHSSKNNINIRDVG